MRRRLLLLLLPAAALLPLPGAGAAVTLETVQDGTVTMTSDPGDWVGQGASYSFSTSSGNLFFARSSQFGSDILVTVRPDPVGTTSWSLEFAAPAGQQLVPGTYTGAQRVSWRDRGAPGLDVNGDGRGCSRVTGSFTVLDAVYEPSGYVDSFHAVFEQHCEGLAPALRGEVRVNNPPPPTQISAHLTIDDTAQLARGAVALHGTISCSRDPDPDMSTIVVDVTEPTKSGDRLGYAAVSVVSCPTTPAPWSANVTPVDPKSPFVKGTASVHAIARLRDPFYGEWVDADSATQTTSFKEG
jgi:hypothetical protein